MKIIDKYIFKELFIPFTSGVLAFSTILFGSTVLFKLIGDAVKYNIPLLDLILLIILKSPYIIALSIPMATLFSTISIFGRLGNDLEIIALRSNGISVLRLLIPVLIFGLIASFTMLSMSEFIVPKSSSIAKKIIINSKSNKKPKIENNINITQYKNKLPYRIINIGQKDKTKLKNITIAEYEEGSLVRLIRSNEGRWIPPRSWEFNNGLMHYFQKDNPKRVTVIEFEKENINLDLAPKDLIKSKKNVEEMNRKELMTKIKKEKEYGNDPIKLIMDYHMKTALAFSPLIYCLLGACMGLRPHRSSSALGIGLSLIIIVGYIILMSVGMGLGLAKALPSLYAAWLPNFIIILISIFLTKKLATT
jgi:lipopolysaccharide export system permease protein